MNALGLTHGHFNNDHARRMIKDLWYKNAVIYCLSVGTYMDANGDGIGDFQGLMRRLDYLHGLGITAIWLMPFQCSPGKDDGYDISDYYGVNPAYRNARRFCRIHPRRQAARHPRDHRSRRQSHLQRTSLVSGGAARSEIQISRLVRLVEKAAAPMRIRAWSFPACRNRPGRAIRREAVVLPSLLRLPARSQHVQSGGAGRNPQDHGILDPARRVGLSHGCRAFRHQHQGRRRDAGRASNTTCCVRSANSCNGASATSIILAEANVLPRTDMQYFGDDGDRMHMMFNFQVNQNLFYALASADTRPLAKAMKKTEERPGQRPMGHFPAQS